MCYISDAEASLMEARKIREQADAATDPVLKKKLMDLADDYAFNADMCFMEARREERYYGL